jgi:hypothetical protein
MSVTRKSVRKHAIKGKQTRSKHGKSKHSVHHKRKHGRKSHHKKRSAHHKRSLTSRRRRRRTRSMRGMRGGSALGFAPATVPSPLIPSDMSNAYRSTIGNVTSISDTLHGVESDPSPIPYKDQLVRSDDLVGEVLRMA